MEIGALGETFPNRPVWGIRNKVLGLVILAALLPTALVGTSSYWTARNTLLEKLSDQLNTRASLTAAKTREWYQERQHDARVFAGSSIVATNLRRVEAGDRSSRTLIRAYLDEVKGRYGVYRSLAVLDDAGGVVASTGEVSNDELVRLETSLEAGAVLIWEPNGANLVLHSPILSDDGRLAGFFVLKCDFHSLLEVLTGTEGGERLRLSTGANRLVLSHPPDIEGDTDLPDDVPEEGGITEIRDSRGVAVLATSRIIKGLDLNEVLQLVVMTDRAVAFDSITNLRSRILLLSALVVLLVVAIAYGFVVSLTDPLERLTAGARAVARNDYATELPVRSGDEIGYLTLVFNQMTSTLKATHERLEHLSTTDELTQLSNRRELGKSLEEEIDEARRSGAPLTVVMIDIDRFKDFNDRLGHLRGDDLLESLGAFLRASVPEGATAARYGGEEFLVLLPDTTLEEGASLADNLRLGFEKHSGEGVTLSLGVAAWNRHGFSPNELIDAADRALYRAKAEGRNRVVAAGDPLTQSAESKKGRSTRSKEKAPEAPVTR